MSIQWLKGAWQRDLIWPILSCHRRKCRCSLCLARFKYLYDRHFRKATFNESFRVAFSCAFFVRVLCQRLTVWMSANYLKKKIKNAQGLSLAGSSTYGIGKLFPLSGIQSKNTFEHQSSPNTILFLFVQFKASYAIESFLLYLISWLSTWKLLLLLYKTICHKDLGWIARDTFKESFLLHGASAEIGLWKFN